VNRDIDPAALPLRERARVARMLFDFLDRAQVRWCVVGDTRGFPDAVASDLDIVVGPEALDGLVRQMGEFARAAGLRLVQLIRHERTALYFVFAWTDDAGGVALLAADFCSDFTRRGRRFLAAEELLAGRAADACAGFPVPAASLRFIYYVVKRVDKGVLDDRHGSYLSACWREDPARAALQLRRFWRERAAADAIERAAGSGDWAAVRGAVRELRRELRRAAPLTPRGALGELGRALERVLRPTGLVVAFLGPDGSGKSSLIERVLQDLGPVFRRTRYAHLRPRVLGSRDADGAPVVSPHAAGARGLLASTAKLAFFVADHLAGYALQIRPAAFRSTLVAFDRHYVDLLADPRRYRYGAPMALARWAAKLIPGPDLWVLVDAPADVVQARKREVAPDESARQRARYLALVRRLPNAAVVDGSRPPAEVALETADAVLRFLEGRLAFRHRALDIAPNPVSARILQFFARRRTPVLARLAGVALNTDLFCRIVAPIHMPHPYGIVIHSATAIGARVTVMQGVTLGAKTWQCDAAPVIEDGVYVGAGAKVLGAVRIGAGAIVGANAVVTRDVPPGATVVGANRIVRGPARSG
jgi:thymidylate kinase